MRGKAIEVTKYKQIGRDTESERKSQLERNKQRQVNNLEDKHVMIPNRDRNCPSVEEKGTLVCYSHGQRAIKLMVS